VVSDGASGATMSGDDSAAATKPAASLGGDPSDGPSDGSAASGVPSGSAPRSLSA